MKQNASNSHERSAKYQVPSINKAIDILHYLDQHGPASFKEIKNAIEIPHSTCFNILSTLVTRGLLEVRSGMYYLGLGLIQLGLSAYSRIDLREIALPVMHELIDKHNETSYLSVTDKQTYEAVVIERVDGGNTLSIAIQIGERVPLYASGTGKALLSGLSDAELENFFRVVERKKFTPMTIITEEGIREYIQEIRKNGYALSLSDHDEGVCSISSPIRDGKNEVVAAISIAGPEMRLVNKLGTLAEDVKKAAMKVSEKLGYRFPSGG